MIRLKNICKDYYLGENSLRVLHDINLEITAGEFISIMGPSGSGKSTLLNILGCLDVGSSGNYYLEGRDVSSLEEDELASIRNRKFGFVFQKFHLIPRLNLVENVSLPMMFAGIEKNQRKSKAVDALKKVGLGHRLSHKTNEISGGESQRVAIARAIVMHPTVLFADEPTGNLDSKVGGEILEHLTQLNKEGQTVIMVTHDPGAAAIARRALHLCDGRIVSDDHS
jgi:putative ABC transport system ATP-binding protein